MVDAEALFLGLVPPLAVLLVAVSVPVPPWGQFPAAAALLFAGAAGGYVVETIAGGDCLAAALAYAVGGAVAAAATKTAGDRGIRYS